MNTTKLNQSDIGCVLDESAGSADDLNLRTIHLAEDYGFKHEPLPSEDEARCPLCGKNHTFHACPIRRANAEQH